MCFVLNERFVKTYQYSHDVWLKVALSLVSVQQEMLTAAAYSRSEYSFVCTACCMPEILPSLEPGVSQDLSMCDCAGYTGLVGTSSLFHTVNS